MHDDHASPPRSERGRYADFVDELFRLKLIDREKRDFLREGLRRVEAPAAAPIVPPASSHCAVGEAGLKRAADAGLAESLGGGRHRLRCGPETVHWGYLSGAAEPVLRIAPGDTVTIDTVSHEGILADQGDPESFFARFGVPREAVLSDLVAVYVKVQHSGLGPHVVSGPIAVAGAEPGDVLAVHVLEATPRVPYGVNTMRMNRGGLPEEFTLNRSLVIPFDLDRGVAKFSERIEVPLAPFFGIMATGPARSLGRVGSGPPGAFGGNIDLKDLTAGSTLYLPVHVPEALFMVGDGHAAQGDGEVDLTAIETSLTGTFRIDLIKGKPLAWPRAETPTHWITLGLHESLDEAMKLAIRDCINFLSEEKGLARADAYALASIAVDFEVTQVVDGVKGIHAMIPKAIFLD
ncbi:MAG TPA: acetamidase/formamidase family protein [Stellaceae bacterium]|jgi:acetamidase/formamidase|nr:acetamidase/formamidase family protein [Stellaceae bacterium]